jgi:hypothetical protein
MADDGGGTSVGAQPEGGAFTVTCDWRDDPREREKRYFEMWAEAEAEVAQLKAKLRALGYEDDLK